MIKMAIDMMGSDLGPKALAEGVKAFLKNHNDIELHLYGDETILSKLFSEENVYIHNTTQIVPMEVGSLEFLRLKESSMYCALSDTAKNDYDAVVSAGSTGGFLTGATLIIKNIEGVRRAGFCAPFLTMIEGKQVAILDIGASNHNSAEDLHCFAKLGSIYANSVWKLDRPGVYILNNGTEEGKGPQEIKDAYALMKADESLNFKGNVEAREVMSGNCDVVVCQGFPGNIYLKASEGMAKNMSTLLSKAFHHSILTKLSYLLVRKQIKHMKEIMNYKKIGGAITLGLNKVVVKAHGNSDGYSFEHALILAYNMCEANIVEKIKEEFR